MLKCDESYVHYVTQTTLLRLIVSVGVLSRTVDSHRVLRLLAVAEKLLVQLLELLVILQYKVEVAEFKDQGPSAVTGFATKKIISEGVRLMMRLI